MSDLPTEEGIASECVPQLLSQRNWQAMIEGKPPSGTIEYPLYTDAEIRGEYLNAGPYGFINTIPSRGSIGEVKASIVVRATFHLEDAAHPTKLEKNEGSYHGGRFHDELAALVSLCLGARIRAGGESRRFDPGEDPLGRPIAWEDKPLPTLSARTNNLVLPSVIGEHSLDHLSLLSSIPKIKAKHFVSLIRACNHYQNALWIAEAEPNLAWLMFVSAIEVAAGSFDSSLGTPVERLQESKPEVVKLLEEAGGADLVTKVAGLIEGSLGATRKFTRFLHHFLPDQPPQRPSKTWLQIDWTPSALKKKVFSKVYTYRSRALHGGTPFPAPMFQPPKVLDYGEAGSEKPFIGLAQHSLGSTWLPEDVPINLHCFHYIVRGALIKWWGALSSEGSSA